MQVMGLRRYAFLLTCALLGAGVAVLPAVAGSETTPTVSAESNAKTCGYYVNCWVPPQVELTAPGTVTFKNASGTAHGVVWSSVPATPTCSGVPVNSSATTFNGTCSFSQPGTYKFYCYVHGPYMSGTVIVNPGGTTTTTTTTTTTGTQPGGTTTTTGTQPGGTTTSTTGPAGTTSAPTGSLVPGSPQPAALAGAIVAVARSQHGKAVRGSIQVTSADAGGRLEVDLLASRASLARAGAAPVRVGRLVRSSVRAGRLSFSVPLNPRGRAALARHRRLALTVKVVLAPVQGPPSFDSRRIVLHP
jgi:plastocyanin